MSPRANVDGMTLACAFPVAGLPDGETRPADWWLALERGPSEDGLADVTWTGDVRDDDRRWARFGRRGPERVVHLEDVACLMADPVTRRARLRHDGDPTDDVAVLRRVAPYLASLLGRLTLHAAAVALPRGGVLLCGGSGAGKSTLALAFDGVGVPVISDDHVVVTAEPAPSPGGAQRMCAHPSFPFVDATPESRHALARDAADPGASGKASVRLVTAPRAAPTRIVAVAFLRRGREAAEHPLRPAEALARLVRDSIFVADPSDDAAQVLRLDAALRLLESAPPVLWTVPEGIDRMRDGLSTLAAPWGGLR